MADEKLQMAKMKVSPDVCSYVDDEHPSVPIIVRHLPPEKLV